MTLATSPTKGIASRLASEPKHGLRQRLILLYSVLLTANVAAWLWAFAVFRDQPVMLGTAFLAYVLGLRHAVDPDHIAAIDNVTRKLLQEGGRPATVGFWFALGHSTVVILACLVIAFLASGANGLMDEFRDIGSLIGTTVSSLFLLVIGIANLAIFIGVWRTFRNAKRTGRYREEDLDAIVGRHGFLSRLLRPLFSRISKSWHMYPLGFLFGLGFDTATEIGLFSLAAANAANGVSLSTVMVFPVLFAVGMALADATDGALMLGAYEWAYVNPIRKLFYNLVITGLSVFIALVIGLVQGVGLIAEKLELSGAFWSDLAALRDHFDILGFIIVGLFIAIWAISALVYKLGGYDSIELEKEA
ncbi:HoxN/HupN/NixA family nickel/cobalt transporter [Methylocella sp. CPCC 101449]|jgi:high-affinity nickel-transport protein|uniref:HoxN/HupN/NixA family nickel/cobalt transporter n=1 Tax=Methylocella sp. CPCC 101449 TaxID=2987531 RepID=UPI00288F20C8|nr:HoxN/HupN/NixA family nickel/cobalt transporter [Methylocella sp. CPCC 101449]MDT2019210.1 HoxN/HupN/NixA family nickel/cobalt transporter [Methylocella sp. CPCC 101449]HEV2573392.1 HoxN/HupN/NixA family nickel/cobalt transporter [Beijerinckiaceae bacterium]